MRVSENEDAPKRQGLGSITSIFGSLVRLAAAGRRLDDY